MNGVLRTWWRSAVRLRCCGVVAALYLYFAIALAFGQAPPPGGTPSDPPSAPIPAPAATADQIPGSAELLLQEVDAIVEKLATAGDKTTAEAFRTEAANIRGRDGKAFEIPKADPYAVHAVYLSEAGPPPPGFGTGADRFTTRYAEIQVGEFAQPTVLVLGTSVKKMHWHVTKHASTRLLAVVVDGISTVGVSGLDESTVVVSANNRDGYQSASWPDPDADDQDGYSGMRSRWSALAGATVLTLSGLDNPPGTPVAISLDQSEFRNRVASRRAKALHRRATNAVAPPERSIPAELANHTFRGIHYLVYQGGQYASTGTAEFTLRGPKAASMKHGHGKLTNFVVDSKENLTFALNGNGLVLLGEGVEQFESIPFDAKEAPLSNLLSLTFDTVRGRIVAATDAKTLYEYDLKLATWSKLEETEYALSSIGYAAELDCFFAFSSDGSDRRDERGGRVPRRTVPDAEKSNGLRILKLSSTGKTLSVVRDGITSEEWPGSGRHHTQVAYSDGKIALFGGCRDDSNGVAAAPVLLVDAESGKTLYTGRMKPWTEAPETKRQLPVAAHVPTPNHRAGRFIRDLFAVERGIERLRKAGATEKADRAAKRLAAVRRIMNGGGTATAGPAVHLVGCYQHRNAEVRVTENTRPVTLVLCAYDPGAWKVTLAEGAKVERVIVGGYHKQQVTGLPAGVPVEYHVYEQGGGAGYFYIYDENSDSHAEALQKIRKLIGASPTTMQVRYELKDEVVEVGPRSPEWCLQHAMPHLNALAAGFVAIEQAERLALLPDWKFRAARRDSTRRDDARRAMAFGGAKTPPAHNSSEWIEYSLRGRSQPVAFTLPDGIDYPVFSDDPELSFGWQSGEVVQFNSRTGETSPVAAPDASLKISSSAPIVIDSRRQRLLFVREPLTEYDIRAKKWTVIRKQTIGGSSIAYSRRDDVLYLLSANNGNWELDHYSVTGVRLKHLVLRFMPPEGVSTSGSQIVDVGDFLGIVSPAVEIAAKNIRTPSRLMVINPDDGSLLHAGFLKAGRAEQALADADLQRLWERLADADDDAMERLAAGGAATVKFVSSQLAPKREFKPDEIAALIEELGHEKLDRRAKAERQLESIGMPAEAALRAAAAHESPEVRARVRTLLAGIGEAAARDPAIRRQVRAIDVLGRIGSAEAIPVLEDAAFGNAAPAVAARALHVLSCIGEGGEPLVDAFEERDAKPDTRDVLKE